MQDKNEISLSQAFRERFGFFFKFENDNFIYKFFKALFVLIFTVPFSVLTVIEFAILSLIRILLWFFDNIFSFSFLIFIRLPFDFILGFCYFILKNVFLIIYWLCNLPDFVILVRKSFSEEE